MVPAVSSRPSPVPGTEEYSIYGNWRKLGREGEKKGGKFGAGTLPLG